VDFVIVRFLMKLFNTTKKLFNTTNQLSIIVDNILTLNCLVLSGLIVSEVEKKFVECDNIFFAKFQS